jgi:asparagine synthase (glutamine-hydrolysing)
MRSLDQGFCVRLRDGSLETGGDPHFFRGHVIARGREAAADGSFAYWDWDGRRLIARTDRYGVNPLFYWRDGGGIGLSPSLLVLLQQGAPAALDHEALSVFLRLGFFLDNDTPFAAVKAVPPNSVLTWQNGTLTITGARPRAVRQAVNRHQALDGFITLFRESIRRRPPEPGATFATLSSGRDSRHIIFELRALGHRPQCVTTSRYPPRPAEDERIAPLVAAAVGVPHLRIPQSASRFGSEIAKNWATHLCADEHAWFVNMIATLGSSPAVMYDGLGGALSVPSRFHTRDTFALVEAGRTRELAERLLTAYSVHTEAYLVRVLRADAAARSRAMAVDRIASELDRHIDAPDPIKSFNFWNRIRRELALVPYGLMKQVPTVYTPYLDHDLYDFLMGVPATVVSPDLIPSDKTFHTDAIDGAFPQYAHIPYENKSAARLDATAHDQQFAGEAGRFIVRHAPHKTRLLNRAYVLPRAAYASVRSAYGRGRPWFAGLSLYLTQLEMAIAHDFPESIGLERRAAASWRQVS